MAYLVRSPEYYLHEVLFMVADPAGTPDCYVDLYDLAALAAHWLTCSDPGPLCSYNP